MPHRLVCCTGGPSAQLSASQRAPFGLVPAVRILIGGANPSAVRGLSCAVWAGPMIKAASTSTFRLGLMTRLWLLDPASAAGALRLPVLRVPFAGLERKIGTATRRIARLLI
jgi:hypothetical protein